MKLPYPFSYYWSKYSQGKCPLCDDETSFQSFDNLDVIHCSIYGGYLGINQDDALAGPNGEGHCKICHRINFDSGKTGDAFIEDAEGDSPYREVVKGRGFLCENCNHGINFDKKEVFQVLFQKHDEKTCKHCIWHNQRDSNNPVKKPDN